MVRLRRRMPGWVDRLIEALLASDSSAARVLKSWLAAGTRVPEPVLPDPSATSRLLIAPYNYAGQGNAWARSIDGTGNEGALVSARSLGISTSGRGFDADLIVPATVFLGSPTWRARWDKALGAYSHVIIESFGSLLGRGTGDALVAEVAQLRGRGIRVGLICHGSDVRSPRAHVARHADVTLSDWGDGIDRLERAAETGARILKRFDGPVFVSTPDLLDDVPEGVWLPVVVDPERWTRAARENSSEDQVSVIHVPSNAQMKGTQHIDLVCARLHEDSTIRYRSLRGVAPAEMPGHVLDADIVVDQLLIGSYGVAACEAMAAGRVVVGNVPSRIRERVLTVTGLALPIVQAEKATLESVLRRLAADNEERQTAGDAGRRFVDIVHSGDWSRAVLAQFLESQ